MVQAVNFRTSVSFRAASTESKAAAQEAVKSLLSQTPAAAYSRQQPREGSPAGPLAHLFPPAEATVNVSGVGPAAAPAPSSSPASPRPATAPLKAPADQVTLSAEGLKVAETTAAESADPLRAARLEQIKAAIAEGTYDDEAKFEAALDRLLESIE